MRTLILLTTVALIVTISHSQEIPIKTVPLETGSQFLLLPSQADMMGGVSIALHDSLADPFTNPAAGVLLPSIRLMVMPSYYSLSQMNSGSAESFGRTFPFSLQFHSDNYFGGILLARQSIVPGRSNSGVVPAGMSSEIDPADRTNSYAQGVFGMRIAASNISIGGGISWMDLRTIEGVQFLYSSGPALRQEGTLTDYRLGLMWDFASEGSWEVVVSHHRRDIQQSVMAEPGPIVYDDVRPAPARFPVESNDDQMIGYGIMTKYQRPISEIWNVGIQLVANRKSYPKIPNYELMNIPRDPGNSLAFNVGMGLATRGKAVFGFDVVYEPVVSSTWADTQSPVTTLSGRILPPGSHTVDNKFTFRNYLVRGGISTFGNPLNLNVGVSLHHYHYRLRQDNRITETTRRGTQDWSEVTLNLGLEFPFSWGRIRYLGLVTMGAGQPGVISGRSVSVAAETGSYDFMDFMIAPSGDLSLNEALIGTHQLSLIFDIP